MVKVVIILVFFLLPVRAEAIHLGRYGRTYPVVERDFIELIKERANTINWERIYAQLRIAFKKRLDSGKNLFGKINLLPAKKQRSFTFQLSYTLPYDIRDINANVIYPEGFTFNPLDYIHYPFVLVVIDGIDDKHISWFLKNRQKLGGINTKVLVTRGNIMVLAEKLNQPVYFVTPEIVKTFNLKYIPCTIRQIKNRIEVTEYVVKENDKD